MKKLARAFILSICVLTLAGCSKKDEQLENYKSEMQAFTERVTEIVTAIDNIDVSSDTRREELLGYLDELDEEFTNMGNLEVPQQFASVEELADDASANLSKSVALYHQAFDNVENYDSQFVEAALEYWNRAFKRIEYIGILLQGELPDDESITIIHEGENVPEAEPETDAEEETDADEETGREE